MKRTNIEYEEETDIVLKQLNVKVGPLCRQFLNNYAAAFMSDDSSKELLALRSELDDVEEKMHELSVRKLTLFNRITAIEESIKQRQKEDDLQKEKIVDSIKAAGVLGDVL